MSKTYSGSTSGGTYYECVACGDTATTDVAVVSTLRGNADEYTSPGVTVSAMRSDPYSPSGGRLYECAACGERDRRRTQTRRCAACGGPMQNLTVPRE
jgi:hypothetical protein